METCYSCGKNFNDCDVIKHDEHIIQQAIGGTLVANDILCEKCGEILGEAIDVPFNKMFDSICTRLDIRKHRDNNKQKTAKGVILSTGNKYGNDLNGVDVFWKKGKVTPIQPFHKYTTDNSKVIVYAEKKQLNKYLSKVKLEIKDKFPDKLAPKIVTCDDIDGLVSYALPLDNNYLKKGLAKIAIGFAAKAGINRINLNMVINFESGEIGEHTKIIPFYPISIFDKIIEHHKKEIRYYPSHTLILFTSAADSKILVCYIELFSTFQWYIILSDSYAGEPIYEGYTQRIDKVDNYIFSLGRRYYKERKMILSSLGITQTKINATYENQKDSLETKSIEEIEYRIIQQEYTKQKYQVIFDNEVESYINYASNKSVQMMRLKSLPFDAAIDIKTNTDLFYKKSSDNYIFNIFSYRRCYVRNGEIHDYILSIIRSTTTEDWRDTIKSYCYEKVYMLSKYIQDKNIADKQKDIE